MVDKFWQEQAEKAQELNRKYAYLQGTLKSILTYGDKRTPSQRVKEAIEALEKFREETK